MSTTQYSSDNYGRSIADRIKSEEGVTVTEVGSNSYKAQFYQENDLGSFQYDELGANEVQIPGGDFEAVQEIADRLDLELEGGKGGVHLLER